MAKFTNQQPSLKPQDLYVLLALLSRGEEACTYLGLSHLTGLAVSAVHGALKRAVVAQLVWFDGKRPVVLKPQLCEFVLFGAKYAFAPLWGTLTRGVPTAYGAAPLRDVIERSDDPVPVWSHPKGSVRGLSLTPLYPSVPLSALKDKRLYEILALFDAIRSGRARERDAAKSLFAEYVQ